MISSWPLPQTNSAMITCASPEDQLQLALLNMNVGEPGSGTVRYAAAMYFHQTGQLSARDLEIYRTLAKDDHSDPADWLSADRNFEEYTQ